MHKFSDLKRFSNMYSRRHHQTENIYKMCKDFGFEMRKKEETDLYI